MTLAIWDDVRGCATDILLVLEDCVRNNRHEHHGDVVDGIRLALAEAAWAVNAPDPLTPDNLPSSKESRCIADKVNARLRPVILGKEFGFVIAQAVWYVRHGLSGARPCKIDVAIAEDLNDFSSSDKFACYREYIDQLRELLARLA